MREILEAIYEQDFLDCSYGFRPKRSAHDPVRAIDRVVHRGEVNWILEADIASYFDTIRHDRILAKVAGRVVDRNVLAMATRDRRSARSSTRSNAR